MIGVGTDIVAVARIAGVLHRHGERFLNRCFAPAEIALALRREGMTAVTLAARWAAKEAFLKALGLPLGAVPLREIEVVHGERGRPSLRLHAQAVAAFADAGARRAHLSISHETDHAVAVVLVE